MTKNDEKYQALLKKKTSDIKVLLKGLTLAQVRHVLQIVLEDVSDSAVVLN